MIPYLKNTIVKYNSKGYAGMKEIKFNDAEIKMINKISIIDAEFICAMYTAASGSSKHGMIIEDGKITGVEYE